LNKGGKLIDFKLNREGVEALMKSPQMQARLLQTAENVRANVGGEGYEVTSGMHKKRAVANVYAATPEAYHHELKHNTLLKAAGAKPNNKK
jgi:isopentenyl phosphate kinase